MTSSSAKKEKDAAASASSTDTSTVSSVEEQPEGTTGVVVKGDDLPPSDSGPGTGLTAPPESSYRPPSTVVSDNDDNPLEPPTDHRTQTQPEQGHNASSTDQVYASTGGRTIAGEDFVALTDIDGKRLRASSLFDESDDTKTWVEAKVRAYEEFYYPNTTEVARRLVLVPGQRIPRAQATAMKQAIKDAPKPLAEQS